MGFFKGIDRDKLVIPLTAVYFFTAIVEVLAELNRDVVMIAVSKPFLMPLLGLLYLCASRKRTPLFLVALVAVWATNLFLISNDLNMMLIGSLCFLVYRGIVILMVVQITKFPGYLPMVIGSLPFLFLYLFVSNLTYRELGENFLLFVLQGILMIFFGGFCLGSYILKSNRPNTFLLISTILFTATQFILVLKLYYATINIFQPLAMLTFVFAQFLLCQYVLLEEKKRRRFKSISSYNRNEDNPLIK